MVGERSLGSPNNAGRLNQKGIRSPRICEDSPEGKSPHHALAKKVPIGAVPGQYSHATESVPESRCWRSLASGPIFRGMGPACQESHFHPDTMQFLHPPSPYLSPVLLAAETPGRPVSSSQVTPKKLTLPTRLPLYPGTSRPSLSSSGHWRETTLSSDGADPPPVAKREILRNWGCHTRDCSPEC